MHCMHGLSSEAIGDSRIQNGKGENKSNEESPSTQFEIETAIRFTIHISYCCIWWWWTWTVPSSPIVTVMVKRIRIRRSPPRSSVRLRLRLQAWLTTTHTWWSSRKYDYNNGAYHHHHAVFAKSPQQSRGPVAIRDDLWWPQHFAYVASAMWKLASLLKKIQMKCSLNSGRFFLRDCCIPLIYCLHKGGELVWPPGNFLLLLSYMVTITRYFQPPAIW